MRRVWMILLFLCVLSGCTSSLGSFEDGSIKMDRLYVKLQDIMTEKEWNLGSISSTFWTKKEIEESYQLDMTKVAEVSVQSSVVGAEVGEIAFFKVTKKQESIIKKAIQYRLQSLQEMYGIYIKDISDRVKNAKQGRIGQYYYLIIGEDSKKVVNYIRNIE